MERKGGTLNKELLESEAKELALLITPKEQAQVVALYGDLGAGKTTFTQAFARALGVIQNITSPTFVVEKRYPLEDQLFDTLIHIDAYRLDNAEDLEKLDWKTTLSNPKNLVVIEWADKVENLLPKNTVRISLEFLDEHTREFTYGKKE